MHYYFYFWCGLDLWVANQFLKKINYVFIYPPLKITFYMGVQNHDGRLLETGGGSEAS